MLRLAGKTLAAAPPPSAPPLPTLFWAAGFNFAPAAALKEVPYDPHLEQLFFGEEATMAARLWTAGWDFYAPPCIIVYHLWSRAGRPTFREHADEQRTLSQRRSQERVRYMLGMQTQVSDPSVLIDFEKYGLGQARSLAAFAEHTGVDFARRQVSERAQYGGRARADFATERAADALALVQALMAGQAKR